RHEINYTNNAEMIQDARIKDRIWKDIHKSMERFGHWEQVKKVAFVSEPFTIEGGELTPTLKLKRKPILAKYEALINDLYND
ncbi:MAG: hypothetical protein RL226_616, partial [Bacteroidota bacterium]